MSTDGVDAVYELLDEAAALEHGRARHALTKEAARLADGLGDEWLAYDCQSDLVESATFAGFMEEAMVAFARCLAHVDKYRDAAGDTDAAPWLDDTDILWQYKWIVGFIHEFPQISRQQIEDTFADIQARFERAGHGLRVLWHKRVWVGHHLGRPRDELESEFERYRATPRDRFSDCLACEKNFEVKHHVLIGEPDRAVELAQPLVEGVLTCGEVPHVTLSSVALTLLRQGDSERARELHRRGYELCRDKPVYLIQLAEHLDFEAMTGELAAAVRILERNLGAALDTRVPFVQFRFLLSAATLCARLRDAGAEPQLRLPQSFALHRDDGRYDLAELHRWFADETATLAARFDARNGNDFISTMAKQHPAGLCHLS